MNAPRSSTELRKSAGSHVGGWMVGFIVVTTAAALGIFLTPDEPTKRETQGASGAATTVPTAGSPLLHDHSVTRDLPYQGEEPGASIAAYGAL